MNIIERLAIGLLAGVLGSLTGLFALLTVTVIPGVSFSAAVYTWVPVLAGLFFLALGLIQGDKSGDALGGALRFIWRVGIEVVSWFRLLR